MITLATIDEVIEQLGGIGAVAELTGRSRENVHNWRSLGRFSAPTFLVMQRALARKRPRVRASPALWGIEEAAA